MRCRKLLNQQTVRKLDKIAGLAAERRHFATSLQRPVAADVSRYRQAFNQRNRSEIILDVLVGWTQLHASIEPAVSVAVNCVAAVQGLMERVIDGKVTLGVTRDGNELHIPTPTKADVLTAPESYVNGLRLAAFLLQPGACAAFVEDLVIGPICVVAVTHEGSQSLTDVPVRLATRQNGLGRKLLHLV